MDHNRIDTIGILLFLSQSTEWVTDRATWDTCNGDLLHYLTSLYPENGSWKISSQNSDWTKGERPGFDSRQVEGLFFSSAPRPDRLWGPSGLINEGPSPRGKAAGKWSKTIPSSAEVKNAWSYISIPIRLHVVAIIKLNTKKDLIFVKPILNN
jgi:hypothetical protein